MQVAVDKATRIRAPRDQPKSTTDAPPSLGPCCGPGRGRNGTEHEAAAARIDRSMAILTGVAGDDLAGGEKSNRSAQNPI